MAKQKKQETLKSDKVVILADYRESDSAVARNLEQCCEVKFSLLKVADYLLSDRIAVERKTASDLLRSLIDGRLFDQAKALKEAYPKPILLLEGSPEPLYRGDINPNSIRGAFASLIADYEIPTLWARDPADSAGMLHWFAKREQKEKKRVISIRVGEKPHTVKELQEYLVSGLPGIDVKRSHDLLECFGNPERVFKASKRELKKVKGIGEKTANKIREILLKKWKS